MSRLAGPLLDLRAAGVRALVPYVMAGSVPDWLDHVEACVMAGASAVEIGIPFSDPMMDGVVIQAAALAALAAGTTPGSLCAQLATRPLDVPLVAMTYYNLFHHYGDVASATQLTDAGFAGAIVPDLSVEEAGPWREACAGAGVATVFLVAPSTPPERVALVAGVSQGFVYASARMAVTGVADDLGDAERVVAGVRAVCNTPIYVGIGITTPAQAVQASFADGVIVGSVLVARILDGATPSDTEAFVASFVAALD